MAYAATTGPRLVQFGVYEVDLQTRELRKAGVRLKLEGQPLQVLECLLERPGQLVTRDELKQRLWPSDTFVDFEHSINAAVKRLRLVLGDTAETPRFIETLPRRGYRFIYPVNGGTGTVLTTSAPVLPSHSRIKLTLVVSGLLVLAAIGFFALRDRFFRSPAPVRSLAVLPFRNLTGASEQEYLADAITDDLTTELAQPRVLLVPSLVSAMYYKPERKREPDIARELGVDALVEGSIQRRGAGLVVNVQLIDGRSDRHLWAKQFAGDGKDVQALAHELANSVFSELKLTGVPRREPSAGTANLEAHAAFLRGRYHFRKGTEDDRNKAHQALEEAIRLDTVYAAAYAQLALWYAHGGLYLAGGPAATRATGVEMANKALQLDANSAEAHTALAWLKISDGDWSLVEQEFRRALELDPNLPLAHVWYAQYLSARHRSVEAIAEADRALQLDPANPDAICHAAFAYGEGDRAIAIWKKAVDLEPRYWAAHYFLSSAYIMKGNYQEAIKEAELSRELRGGDGAPERGRLAYAHAKLGQRAQALQLLQPLEDQYQRGERGVYLSLAVGYMGLGDRERALAVVQRAFEQHGPIIWFNADPLLTPLHSDARYQELIRRAGLQ